MKQLKTAFNRIQVQWSVDSGYKVLITDIAGNGRLVFNGGDINKDLCSYFKYDKRSRIAENGYSWIFKCDFAGVVGFYNGPGLSLCRSNKRRGIVKLFLNMNMI
mgnify:CR=1 FL=1